MADNPQNSIPANSKPYGNQVYIDPSLNLWMGTTAQKFRQIAEKDDLDNKEDVSNKSTDLTSPDNVKYPTTKAVADAIAAIPASPSNLALGTITATAVPITNSNGTGVTLPAATTALAGVMIAADKTKLNGIATGATANSTDAQLRDRTTHTGVQAISTVSGLQTALDALIPLAQKGAANGVSSLGPDGKILAAQLPSLIITDTFVVNSQAAMLALTAAEQGDIAIRTDLNKSFILKQSPSSVLANWQELLTPLSAVTSVNGQTGAVVLTTTQINEGTNLYYTDARVRLAVNNSRKPIDVTGDLTIAWQSDVVPGDTLTYAQKYGNYIQDIRGVYLDGSIYISYTPNFTYTMTGANITTVVITGVFPGKLSIL